MIRKKVIKAGLCLAVFLCFMMVNPVLAKSCGGADTSIIECDEGGTGSIWHILMLVIDIMTIGIGILGVIGILVCGIQYLTAGGDVGKTTKAKNRMIQIVVGLVAFAVLWTGAQWLLPGGILNSLGKVESVKVSFEEDSLEVGKVIKPTVEIEGDDKTFSLESDNPSIATVYSDGTVHCNRIGSTAITVIAVDGQRKSTTINCVEPQNDDNGGDSHVGGTKEFEAKHEVMTDVEGINGIGGYVLDVPEGATDGMPLIVYLAGDGEKYSANGIEGLKPVQYIMNGYKGSTPYISIAPYLQSNVGWKSGDVKGLIDKIVKQYNINTDKIYAIGMSSGATRTWNLVNDNPNLFAAVVPVSNFPQYDESPLNFKHTKVHGAVGSGEYANAWGNVVERMQSFARRINENGGNAVIDVYQGENHGTITNALKIEELVDWMLRQ